MRTLSATALLAALSAVSAVCAVCAAQTPPANLPLDPVERSISVDVIGGARLVPNNTPGYSEFVSPSVSFSRPLSRHFEGSIVLLPAIVISQPKTQPPTAERETVWAGGADLGLRWYPAPSQWRWTPFLDALAGVTGASHRTPARGTNFNFNVQTGVGVLLPSSSRWRPFMLLRWHHVSNGNWGHRNPSWDQWAVGAGAKLTFKPAKASGS